MLRGLTTVNFFADDVPAAVSGTPSCSASSRTSSVPRRPGGYVEFRIGTYSDELGIIDRKYAAHPTAGPAG